MRGPRVFPRLAALALLVGIGPTAAAGAACVPCDAPCVATPTCHEAPSSLEEGDCCSASPQAPAAVHPLCPAPAPAVATSAAPTAALRALRTHGPIPDATTVRRSFDRCTLFASLLI